VFELYSTVVSKNPPPLIAPSRFRLEHSARLARIRRRLCRPATGAEMAQVVALRKTLFPEPEKPSQQIDEPLIAPVEPKAEEPTPEEAMPEEARPEEPKPETQKPSGRQWPAVGAPVERKRSSLRNWRDVPAFRRTTPRRRKVQSPKPNERVHDRDKVQCGSVYFSGDRWWGFLRIPGERQYCVCWSGSTRLEAELAVALAKAEWLYQRIAEECGVEVFRRMLEQLDVAGAYSADVDRKR
jgi:hypothetical protein